MFTPDDPALALLAQRLGAQLLQQGKRVATAESCTGGYVAKLLTDIPGSSRWFECGWVTYSNAAKEHQLSVPSGTLQRQGAVSEATVRAMASGALKASKADIAIAISGVAGPAGGSAKHPIGSVWFARADARPDALPVVQARHHHFEGDRDAIRRGAAGFALEWLLEG
jgi:nicotinamide-nucleotide amidase